MTLHKTMKAAFAAALMLGAATGIARADALADIKSAGQINVGKIGRAHV